MAAKEYPIEVALPDIEPHRGGNVGVEFVHHLDSGRPGPQVLINALTHGNEVCGAIALDRLLREGVRPSRGGLTFCFVNVEAYRRFDAKNPRGSRFVDEDMNRLWIEDVLDGPRDSIELRRARVLRPVIESADFLLDIHSMGTPCAPMMLCHGLAKERALARKVGYPAHVVCGPAYAKGKRMIEFTPFNDQGNGRVALLVECGQHWARTSATAALDTALHFLRALDMISKADFARLVTDPAPRDPAVLDVTEGVTATTGAFRFVADYQGLERIAKRGTIVARDGDRDVVTPYDDCVLIMPNYHAGQGQRALRFARVVG